MRKDAVILIPSYEPDELLINTVKELYDEGFSILVVNDGSSEDFDYIFKQITSMATYEKYEKNQGKGGALKYGFKRIKSLFPEAEFVITADGDGQHALHDIISVYDELKQTDEMVFGVRDLEKMPPNSKFGNEFSKTTRFLVTKDYISDDQCGLRGFPVRYIKGLARVAGKRYQYEMNQMINVQMSQRKVTALPIDTIYLDNNSRSHFVSFQDTFRIQLAIFLNWLPALITFIGSLVAILVMYANGLIYNGMTVLLVFGIAFLVKLITYSIMYPTKRMWRRVGKELLTTVVEGGVCFIITYFLFKYSSIPFGVYIPISMLLGAGLMYLLFWVNRKQA